MTTHFIRNNWLNIGFKNSYKNLAYLKFSLSGEDLIQRESSPPCNKAHKYIWFLFFLQNKYSFN